MIHLDEILKVNELEPAEDDAEYMIIIPVSRKLDILETIDLQ